MLVLFLGNIHTLVVLVEYHKKRRPVVRDKAISKLTSMRVLTLKPILKNMDIGIHVSDIS